MKSLLFSKALIQKLFVSFKRFPLAMVLAVATMGIYVFLNHAGGYASNFEELKRLAMVLALGIPLFLVIQLFFEKCTSLSHLIKYTVFVIAAASLVGYYYFLLTDFSMVSLTRYTAISIALYIIFTFIPYFVRRECYEHYFIQLLISFFVTYLYSIVLYLGLAAILFTIGKLFTIDITYKPYVDVWLIVAGIFAPGFFLADIPLYDFAFDPGWYPKVLRVLFLYIVLPIITVYAAILYTYFAKILITRQWPDGIVSNLVLWYGIISTFTLFFIYPLRNSLKWPRLFINIFPKLMLPLLAMMFVSIFMRIQAYGITENRYFVIAAGLWVTGSVIYYSVVKNVRNIFLLLSLSLLLVLSVFGPWSSYNISMGNQNDRLEQILTKYQMIKNGAIVKTARTVSQADKKQIGAILSYFETSHSLANVKHLPLGFTMDQMDSVFGFKNPDDESDNFTYFVHQLSNNMNLLDIRGYDYFINLPTSSEDKTVTTQSVQVVYNTHDSKIEIHYHDKIVYTKNINEITTRIHELNKGKTELSINEMSYSDQNASIKVLFLFQSINGYINKSSEFRTHPDAQFYLFIALLAK